MVTRITKEEVEKVARLARLEMTDAEKEAFSEQLSSILTYAEQLRTVETAGIEPTATVLHQKTPLRADEVRSSMPVEKVLANAPDHQEGLFVVPRILEER